MGENRGTTNAIQYISSDAFYSKEGLEIIKSIKKTIEDNVPSYDFNSRADEKEILRQSIKDVVNADEVIITSTEQVGVYDIDIVHKIDIINISVDTRGGNENDNN